eukprot:g1236.t1
MIVPAFKNLSKIFYSKSEKYDFQFESPKSGCLHDPWDIAYGKLLQNNVVTLQYHIISNDTLTDSFGFPSGPNNCDFLDVFTPHGDNNNYNGMYVRSYEEARQHPMDFAPHNWLRVAAAWVVRSSIVTFIDKTKHLSPGIRTTPGGAPHYNGQWMRDSFYGISMGWNLVNKTMQTSFLQSAEWMFSHARKDGILPVSCQNDEINTCYYENPYVCNDTVGAKDWELCQDLDTSSFATKLFSHIWNNYDFGDDSNGKEAFYLKWKDVILRSLEKTTKDPNSSGLIWSNTSFIQIGYGFQDDEIKSGNVLYTSILYWNSTLEMAAIAEEYGDLQLKSKLENEALKLQKSATKQLWNPELGVFMASTGLEKQNVDIWGNAMASAIGFANEEQSLQIFSYFKENIKNIFYEGQVREVPFPTQWSDRSSAKFIDPTSTVRIYQNGGFWATPHHHVLPFIGKYDKEMACKLLNNTIKSFRTHGINEWIGPFWPASYIGAPGYTASATNTYFASEHLRCWEI